nr:type IIL restriction-modification enzyme MmeI [Polynucleobacter sp. MWH-P3-07-1]
MDEVFSDFEKHRYLDFVACWFWKGAQYIAGTNSELSFVATNSLCQGEQVALLWPRISTLNISMHIAYQSFPWKNNAKNNAGVHVVIIGLSCFARKKFIFSNQKDIFLSKEVSEISPYLLEGNNSYVISRAKPLCSVSQMVYGNKPVDGGHLILDKRQYESLIESEPSSRRWIKRLYGADDFLNGKERYCLWLLGISSDEINSMPEVLRRVEQVKLTRLASPKAATRKLSEVPHLFGEIRQQMGGHYILIPRVSSERRIYMPTAFLDSEIISTDGNQTIPNGTLYDFGIINSSMHLDWMRTVCGRLESRFNYSATIVYNTFPWPNASSIQKKEIESLSEKILLVRENFPQKTLAQLYDPDLMPAELLEAHQALDVAVEKLYRERPFKGSSERLEHLFKLYEKLTSNNSDNQANGELW